MTELVQRRHYHACMSKIGKFRAADELSDIDLIVDGNVFKCHRLVLSAASRYFERMFIGKFKESHDTEINLRGIEAHIFEEVLQFIYTGKDVALNSTNIYDMFRAADFYELELLEEMCTEFVLANLNAVADDVLSIFKYANTMGKERLVAPLSRHIRKNFLHFSGTADFCKLTFTSLQKILSLIGDEDLGFQDMFFEGILKWVWRQDDVPVEQRRSDFDELIRYIRIKYLSVGCVEYLTKYYAKEFVSSRSISGNDDFTTIGAVSSMVSEKLLRAYVTTTSKIGNTTLPTTTSVFTLYQDAMSFRTNSAPYTFTHTGELECSPNFMRNVVIDNHRIYSLSFFMSGQDTNSSRQTFRSSSSALMYPYVSLKPPPLIFNEFDMCAMNDHIYVYNKRKYSHWLSGIEIVTKLVEDQRTCGLYLYKPEIDEWFRLPGQRMMGADACMTCDDKRVYIFGGANLSGFVQAYDPRTPEWCALSPTINSFRGAACCYGANKIYVAGGQQDATRLEMYDPVCGHWQVMKPLEEGRQDEHQLVYLPRDHFYGTPRVLSFNNISSPSSSFVLHHPDTLYVNRRYEMNFSYCSRKHSHKNIIDNRVVLDMIYL